TRRTRRCGQGTIASCRLVLNHSYPPAAATAATPAVRNERRVRFLRNCRASSSGRRISRRLSLFMRRSGSRLQFVAGHDRLEVVPAGADYLRDMDNEEKQVPDG